MKLEIRLKSFEKEFLIRATKQIEILYFLFSYFIKKQNSFEKKIVPFSGTVKPFTFGNDTTFLKFNVNEKKNFLDLKKKNDYCKIFFPKKKTSFTILRSPHVHKKARDQYHIKRNKGLFLFSFPKEKQEESFLFLKYLTQISFIGVQIHIKMNNVTYLPHLGA